MHVHKGKISTEAQADDHLNWGFSVGDNEEINSRNHRKELTAIDV